MIGLIALILAVVIIVIEKTHKHKWSYKFTSRDQDGCIDYDLYVCEKCFKTKKGKRKNRYR